LAALVQLEPGARVLVDPYLVVDFLSGFRQNVRKLNHARVFVVD